MIYDDLGVPRIINAYGTNTRLSGGLMAPEVLAAMAEAARATVEMHHLQAAASREIAKATGAEAGIVTSGASAAVLLGAAACMARLDPGAMNRLPDTRGLPDEFITIRSQRNMYDRALRVAGGRIIEIGIPDRVSGPGVRGRTTIDGEAELFTGTDADWVGDIKTLEDQGVSAIDVRLFGYGANQSLQGTIDNMHRFRDGVLSKIG